MNKYTVSIDATAYITVEGKDIDEAIDNVLAMDRKQYAGELMDNIMIGDFIDQIDEDVNDE